MKQTILEAYNETLLSRAEEKNNITEGSIVEDFGGNRFEIVAFSESYEDVKEYDKNNRYEVITEAFGEDVMWIAAKDVNGNIEITVYGDDGVTLVKESKQTETSKIHNDILDAYSSVIEE
jgi:hypothetical protein